MIHSYTSLAEWRLCPRLHKARFIDRTVKFVETDAVRRGREMHTALERAVEAKAPLPEGMKVDPELYEFLLAAGARAEVPLAVDRQGQPCEFFDNKRAWIRGKIDVYLGLPRERAAFMADWKSGNPRYTDPLQGEVYTAMLHWILSGRISRSLFAWIYPYSGEVKAEVFSGEKAAESVQQLAERVEADTEHPPLPSWKCRFCDLTSCEYNKREA